jgi:hypothetical protein
VVGRRGENFGAEKRWKKKIHEGREDGIFCSSPKRLQRPHPQLVHWWLLIHSSRELDGCIMHRVPTCSNKAYRTDLDIVMKSLTDFFGVQGSFSSTDFRNS